MSSLAGVRSEPCGAVRWTVQYNARRKKNSHVATMCKWVRDVEQDKLLELISLCG